MNIVNKKIKFYMVRAKHHTHNGETVRGVFSIIGSDNTRYYYGSSIHELNYCPNSKHSVIFFPELAKQTGINNKLGHYHLNEELLEQKLKDYNFEIILSGHNLNPEFIKDNHPELLI